MKKKIERYYRKAKALFPDERVSVEIRFENGYKYSIWTYGPSGCASISCSTIEEAYIALFEDKESKRDIETFNQK